MGGGSFDHHAYSTFTASTVGKATTGAHGIYSASHLDPYLDPKEFKIRESRDSTDNPKSTPIAVALDVTGSMGSLADVIAREGLGTLFSGILERKPVSDPHLMFMAVGDVAAGDRGPIQVSQYEADNRIVEQLTKIWVEGGGGGNHGESYNLAWYIAAFRTVHDSMEKRGKRGYLFTVGDEPPLQLLTKKEIERATGDKAEQDFDSKTLLALAQRNYDCYHIIIAEGNHARYDLGNVTKSWRELLGQKVIVLEDHRKLAETIVSAIEVAEGVDAHDSAGKWGGMTAKIVGDAVAHLPRGTAPRLPGPRT
jgi:hypothetical protein